MLGQLINTFLPTRAATVQSLGHPAAGIIGWTDAAANTAGVNVTEQTALTFSAVWCANRIISETLATLPCVLYRKTGDDNRERATDDPRYFLMHDEPHPSIVPVTYFETMTSHVVMTGNCYSRIIRDQRGEIVRLEPKLPLNMQVEVSGDRIVYTDTQMNMSIPQEDMLHVLGIGGDGITGWSVVKTAANSIGGGLAGEKRANSQYKNGAMPGGALVHPMRLQKDAREHLRKEWEEIHGGSDKANRVAILHGGMDFKPFSMSNEDAQFLQSRKFSIEEIARWFRVPLHMLAHLENSSVRANIEQAAIEFIVYSMSPWLIRWQQALCRKLLTREERQSLYFEFLLASLLRGDMQSRNAAYSTARQWGWLSVNDIRKLENMNAIEGGDIYLQPSNMVPAGTVPDTLTQDMQGNLAASLQAIQEQAATLKADIATGHNSLADILAGHEHRIQQELAGLRADRLEIKADMAAGTKAQVQGSDLAELALAMWRESLACCVKIESSQAIKAARRQQEHGESFLSWLDKAYDDFSRTLLERTHRQAALWERATGQLEGDWVAAWCRGSREALLAAADGDPDGFTARVQAVVDGWEQRVQQATPALEGCHA